MKEAHRRTTQRRGPPPVSINANLGPAGDPPPGLLRAGERENTELMHEATTMVSPERR